MTSAAAAAEIGNLINHILALAPDAGLYVSIKVEPARNQPNNPQHFGADVGGVGDVADFIHGASN